MVTSSMFLSFFRNCSFKLFYFLYLIRAYYFLSFCNNFISSGKFNHEVYQEEDPYSWVSVVYLNIFMNLLHVSVKKEWFEFLHIWTEDKLDNIVKCSMVKIKHFPFLISEGITFSNYLAISKITNKCLGSSDCIDFNISLISVKLLNHFHPIWVGPHMKRVLFLGTFRFLWISKAFK